MIGPVMFDVALELVAILFGVGIIIYGARMSRVLRGGMFGKPFGLLVLSPSILALGWIFHVMNDLGFGSGEFDVAHSFLEISFLAVFLYAIMLLYHTWRRLSSGKGGE